MSKRHEKARSKKAHGHGPADSPQASMKSPAAMSESAEMMPRMGRPASLRVEEPHGEPWMADMSRQQAMAMHSREMRTKMSVGQSGTMRLKRGHQPRGNRQS